MDHIHCEPRKITEILYDALRACRPNFNASEYKWRIGSAIVINEFHNDITARNPREKRTLYGIDLEIDYLNPYNIQLFEDITNKIAVEYKGDIKDE